MKQMITEYRVNLPCGVCQKEVEKTLTVFCSGACKVKASRLKKITQYKTQTLDPNELEPTDVTNNYVTTKKPVTNNYTAPITKIDRSKFFFRTKACPKHKRFTCCPE